MPVPADLQYTEDHLWVRTEPQGSVTIGITDYGQQLLGDIVELVLPSIGAPVQAGSTGFEVSAVAGYRSFDAPVDGAVAETNPEAFRSPGAVDESPYDTWLLRVEPWCPLTGLLGAAEYQALVEADSRV